MKKTGRSLAILIMAMMIATPFMSFATEEAVVVAPQKEEAVTSEVTTEDADEVKSEEAAETEKSDEDALPAAEIVPEEAEATEPEQTETAEPETAEAGPTKVTVAKSAEDLAKKSDAARDNEAFFTIDASKKKTSADLATDEIQQEVRDILKSGDSNSDKQTEIADALQDSGYYSTEETGKAKVDVTSTFAFQRLRLAADKEKEINAYGATKAVYYDGHYQLSYESMEDTKLAYDALVEEYGEKAVLIDIPVSTQAEVDWGAEGMGLYEEKARIDALPDEDEEAVTVAVVDTGIDPNHEVFSGRTIISGGNYVTDDPYPTDDMGHGTEVASIVAQYTPDNVQIMVYKALNKSGKGSLLDVFNAIEDASDKGADIINLSLGFLLDETNPKAQETIKGLMEYDEHMQEMDALIVCASGNHGYDLDNDRFEVPGEFESTVCVGSVDSDWWRSSFSNFGSAIDFAAPGKNVLVAKYNSKNGYKYDEGTSFAAPYISAAAASLKAGGTFEDKDKLRTFLVSMSKDLGKKGKDIFFGDGCPVFSDITGPVTSGNLAFMRGLRIIPEKTVYTGEALEPSTKVKIYDLQLDESDYTISYSDNTKAGKGKITVIGKGSETDGYYGSITKTFTIAPKEVALEFDISADSFNYTGGGITPEVTNVKADGTALVKDEDYKVSYSNNVYPGRGTVTVTCIGNYSGSASKEFDITSHIGNAAVSVGSPDYTGGAVYPGVGVTIGNRRLGEGSDYYASYSDNVYIGTGHVTITGTGYYYGSVTVPFLIGPKATTCKKPSKAKKAITVKWSAQKSKMPKSRVTGYQVQVSRDPNFGSGVKTYKVKGYRKTSRKVSKLARKTTYYARVRTYIKTGGAYYYSNWSNVRSAKTK